jgi:hypothetical protein
MRKWMGAFGAAGLLALLGTACGQARAGGDAGSESHWLNECSDDADCELGQCLCGVCTVACNSVRQCPEPLDTCRTGDTEGNSCELKLCGSSQPAENRQALASAAVPPIHRYPACDAGRQDVYTFTDLGHRDENATSGSTATGSLLGEAPQGFLAFGGDSGLFYRIDPGGNLLRTLAPPNSAFEPKYHSATPLADGSLLLSGRFGSQVWVGKVGDDWRVWWEHAFETRTIVRTQIAALPDGGAVVTAVDGQQDDMLQPKWAEMVRWVRLSSDGRELWQHEEATTPNGFEAPVSVVGDAIYVAVSQSDGLHLVACDLDGACDSTLVQAGPEVLPSALVALPNDRLGVVSRDVITVLDSDLQPVWEQQFSNWGARAYDALYEPVRGEIVVVGAAISNDGEGSWAGRFSLEGDLRWAFSRVPWPNGPVSAVDSDVYGYSLSDLAADAEGHIAARSPAGSLNLDVMWVDAEACGG